MSGGLNLQVAFSPDECNVLFCALFVSSIKKTVCLNLGHVQSLLIYSCIQIPRILTRLENHMVIETVNRQYSEVTSMYVINQ